MIIHHVTIQKLPKPDLEGAQFQGNIYTIGVDDSTKNKLWPTLKSVELEPLMIGLGKCIEEEIKQQ